MVRFNKNIRILAVYFSIFLCTSYLYSQSFQYDWVKPLGAYMGSSYNEQIMDVAVDASNNVYVVGNSGGTGFDFGGTSITSKGSTDAFVAKYDQNKNLQWVKCIGGGGLDYGYSIALDASNNVYICGEYAGSNGSTVYIGFDTYSSSPFTTVTANGRENGYVAKLNSSGAFQWFKTFGSSSSSVHFFSIAVDPNNNIYTTGYFTGTVDFDPGAGTSNLVASGYASNTFVSKLDNSGNYAWAIKFNGGTYNDVIGRTVISDANNVYVSGYFTDAVNFKLSSDYGSKTLTGSTTNFGDYFIIKVNASGTSTIWYTMISRSGAAAYTEGRMLAFSGDKSKIYATGEQGSNTFVARLTNGNFSTSQDWIKNFSGGTSQGQAITIGVNDTIYTTGNFSGTVDFDPSASTKTLVALGTKDAYLSCLDKDGNYLIKGQLGGTSTNNNGMGIALGTSGIIYNVGWFTTTTDFDPSTGVHNEVSQGARNAYVLKLHKTLTSLPVKLTSFTGKAIREGNQLRWETASERNNDYFEVQSTIDGISYETIGRIKGNGTTSHANKYEYLDVNPQAEVVYYRLRQVDFDGRSEYHGPISIGRSGIDNGVSMFPNPFNEKLNIEIQAENDGFYTFSFIDLTGRVTSSQHEVHAGNNNFEMKMNDLAKGIYLVRVTNERGELMTTQKLFKE